MGERNGRYTDGFRTKVAIEERRWVRSLIGVFVREIQSVPNNGLVGTETSHEDVRRSRRPIISKVKRVQDGQRIAAAPDDNVAEWRQRLRSVLGTASPLFVEASLKQLIYATRLPGQCVANTTSLSAALELVASLEPRNEAEAAMAIQIACLHSAIIEILGRVSLIGERNVIAMTTSAAHLQGAFRKSLESYRRLKNGNVQIVRVEKVEVQAGANAVLGVVTACPAAKKIE